MQIGIQPDILVCRSEQPLSADIKRKIALFCNVDFGCVIESPDVRSIYEIPLRFLEQGLDREVCTAAPARDQGARSPRAGRQMIDRMLNPTRPGAHRGGRQVHRPARRVQVGAARR